MRRTTSRELRESAFYSRKGGETVKKNRLKRLSAAALAIMMTMTIPSSLYVFADTDVDITTTEAAIKSEMTVERVGSFSDYYDQYVNEKRPIQEILVYGKDYISTSSKAEISTGSYEGKDNVMIWANQEGSVTYEIDVAETGIYNLEFSYYPITGRNTVTEIEVMIDGEVPYDTASRIELQRRWVNAYPIKTNSKDNQMKPPQIEEPEWTTLFAKDTDGLFNDPLFFYLEKGKHTVTINSTKASFALESMKFAQSPEAKTYAEVGPNGAEINSTPSYLVRIEGEDAIYKTASTLSPTYDRNSYMVSPSHPVKMRYNTIGLDSWNKAGQTIAWEVSVENDGWYKVAIKGKQSTMRGFYSNRRLYIDGVVPYAEANQVKFNYNSDWQLITPTSEDGNEMYFYLTAGTHELKLEVVPGDIGDSMRRLDDIVFEINEYYRRVLMITGPNSLISIRTTMYINKSLNCLANSQDFHKNLKGSESIHRITF